MRRGHYAPKTIARYRCCLIQAARSLKRGLGALRREDVRLLPDACSGARRARDGCARTLHTWLKSVGRFERDRSTPWQTWLDDYAGFMEADHGLSSITRYHIYESHGVICAGSFVRSRRFGDECGRRHLALRGKA